MSSPYNHAGLTAEATNPADNISCIGPLQPQGGSPADQALKRSFSRSVSISMPHSGRSVPSTRMGTPPDRSCNEAALRARREGPSGESMSGRGRALPGQLAGGSSQTAPVHQAPPASGRLQVQGPQLHTQQHWDPAAYTPPGCPPAPASRPASALDQWTPPAWCGPPAQSAPPGWRPGSSCPRRPCPTP